MSEPPSEASSPAGVAEDAPVFATRERRARTPREVIPRLLVLVAAVLVVLVLAGDRLHPAWGLSVAVLAIPLSLRLRPRSFEVYPDHLKVGRGSRRERISLLELTGLAVRSGAPSGGQDWSEVVQLRTITLRLDLADLEDPAGAWRALERYIVPALASSYVELLEKGRELDLGVVQARPEAVRIDGASVPWSHLGPVGLRPDGVLIHVRGRPDLAAVFPAKAVPGAPLLGLVRDAWLKQGGGSVEAPALPPPEGMRRFPAAHSGLGALYFARRRAGVPAVVRSTWILGGLALLGGAGALGTGVSPPAGWPPLVWLAPGGALLCLGAILGRALGRPRGTQFAAYEGGLLVDEGAIPWDGVRSLTLGQGDAGSVVVEVEGEHLSARLSIVGAGAQAYVGWFREELVPRLARRDLMRIQGGESVAYSHASVTRAGLRVGDQDVPWEEIIGVAVEGGATQVVRLGDRGRPLLAVPEDSPDAAVFTRVVQIWLSDQARSDAETSAVAEAAALAAAASVGPVS